MLTCSKCGGSFPATREFFYAAPRNVLRDGLHSWCKPCVCAGVREERRQNPERDRARGRHHARIKRLRSYGLEQVDYDRLLEAQDGVCAICRRPETVGTGKNLRKNLAVDHDHETGEVRGLLCMMCNTGIGKLREDPAILGSAIAYLARARAVRA